MCGCRGHRAFECASRVRQPIDEIGVVEVEQWPIRDANAEAATDPRWAFSLEAGGSAEEESDEPLSQQIGGEHGKSAAVWM